MNHIRQGMTNSYSSILASLTDQQTTIPLNIVDIISIQQIIIRSKQFSHEKRI